MTHQQSRLIYYILQPGYYLQQRRNHNGRDGYMLYSGHCDPQGWYSSQQVKCIRDLLKKDKTGREWISLQLVIKEHGNSMIKREYKKQLKSKKQKPSTHDE